MSLGKEHSWIGEGKGLQIIWCTWSACNGGWWVIKAWARCICECAMVVLAVQIISATTQPAMQTDMHHNHHYITFTHATGMSLHCTSPTKASTSGTPDHLQSLNLSYALQLCSFSRLTVTKEYLVDPGCDSHCNLLVGKNKTN